MSQLSFRARTSAGSVLALSILLLVIGVGCQPDDAGHEVVYRVNSFRVPCVGVAPMSCLQVQREDASTDEWQNFYSQIEGFDYQPGYVYRILVRETRLPPDRVPADASSIRFELIRVLDRSSDPRLAVHDIWVLQALGSDRVDAFDPASSARQPYIEFNVTRGDYLGNDGCDEIRGRILSLDAENLRLGRNELPRSSCGDGVLQARFHAALESVRQWRRDGLRLLLNDESSEEVFAFHKTD